MASYNLTVNFEDFTVEATKKEDFYGICPSYEEALVIAEELREIANLIVRASIMNEAKAALDNVRIEKISFAKLTE